MIAVVATCCLLVVAAQGGFRDGHRHRFYPHYPSFSRGVDVAQDPNTVDENYGWSWGASQGNQQQQQQNNNNPYNADFSFNSNEFFGGLNGAGQGQGGNFNGGGFNNPGGNQQQNQGNPNVPSRPVTTVTPTTTAPVTTAAPAAPTQPGRYYDPIDKCYFIPFIRPILQEPLNLSVLLKSSIRMSSTIAWVSVGRQTSGILCVELTTMTTTI